MWTAKWILEAYEKGDDAARLDMYLAYPDLRENFDGMEALPEKPVQAAAVPGADKPAEAWWNHCCRLVRG